MLSSELIYRSPGDVILDLCVGNKKSAGNRNEDW
jgi:hypothetical protein